jgi:malate dehydrogenase
LETHFTDSFLFYQPNGVAKIHDLGNLSPQEQELVKAALPELKKNIEKGVKFAA